MSWSLLTIGITEDPNGAALLEAAAAAAAEEGGGGGWGVSAVTSSTDIDGIVLGFRERVLDLVLSFSEECMN